MGYKPLLFEKAPPARVFRVTQKDLAARDLYLAGRYIVEWSFGEECEYRGAAGRLAVDEWTLSDGTPCFNNRYFIDVVISPDLQPERVDVKERLRGSLVGFRLLNIPPKK